MANFENIQVGDKLIVSNRYSNYIGTVDKITKTQFHIGSYKFKKTDGCEVGQSWSGLWCEPYDVVKAMEINRLNLNKKLHLHISKNGLDLSLDNAIKLKTWLGI